MLYAALSHLYKIKSVLLRKEATQKRRANEAVGAGWLMNVGDCAPVPSALFAAEPSFFAVIFSNKQYENTVLINFLE